MPTTAGIQKRSQNRREHLLERALCRDINCLEAGLKIIAIQKIVKYPGEGRNDSNPGRIDVLAKDKNGTIVIVELKAGKAGRRAIGQLLGYMGALMGEKRRVRGFLVARRFSPQAVAAARPVPRLKLIKISQLGL